MFNSIIIIDKKIKIILFFLIFIVSILFIILLFAKRESKKETKAITQKQTKETESIASFNEKEEKKIKFEISPTLQSSKKYKEAKKITVPTPLTTPKIPFDIKPFETGYQLGKVIITFDDLKYKFNLYYLNNEIGNINHWQKIADLVSEEAILLNEAIKEGIIPENENRLNPQNVNKARDYFETEGTTFLSGEIISVWFYNMNPPKIGVEAAKKKVNPIIINLRERIINNEITMKQAGEIIAQTEELKEIDPSYQTNAYFSFQYKKVGQSIFNDKDLDKISWQMKTGEISPVLVGKDCCDELKNWYEAYFTVIKINKKEIKEFDILDQLIKKRLEEGMKINLNL